MPIFRYKVTTFTIERWWREQVWQLHRHLKASDSRTLVIFRDV
ncbi:MAG: hypothetical protein QNJ74_22860 [Trichodesmium sp. MO_231.B1]|nr:hypothetical protein [Trichodesmium sp. MO_231.B1]